MEFPQMAATHIRKTFHYPDSDSDSGPEELDEEHQETLIATLQRLEAEKNDQYRRVLFLVPALSAAFLIYVVVFGIPTARARLFALMSLSSVLCTWYIFYFMPIRAPEKKGKRAVYQVEAEKGPVEKYLVWLNGALAALLLLTSVVMFGREGVEETLRDGSPTFVFGLLMFARLQMAPLDFEDLQRARYEYKGA